MHLRALLIAAFSLVGRGSRARQLPAKSPSIGEFRTKTFEFSKAMIAFQSGGDLVQLFDPNKNKTTAPLLWMRTTEVFE